MSVEPRCVACVALGIGHWNEGAHQTQAQCEQALAGRRCPHPEEHHTPVPELGHDFLVVCRGCGLKLEEDDYAIWSGLAHAPASPCRPDRSEV